MRTFVIVFAVLLLILPGISCFAQRADTWNVFARTKFEPKFDEKMGEYIFYPKFGEELRGLEGKEVTIEGYYVPFAPEGDDYIIISKYPMSQCFFCGGGGPESVAEVNFITDPGAFKVDDLITVRGRLKLNAEDPDHINFILTDAVLLSDH